MEDLSLQCIWGGMIFFFQINLLLSFFHQAHPKKFLPIIPSLLLMLFSHYRRTQVSSKTEHVMKVYILFLVREALINSSNSSTTWKVLMFC